MDAAVTAKVPPAGIVTATATRGPRLNKRITGEPTMRDWIATRDALLSNPSGGLWQRAFKDFFRQRIATRYLRPIAKLRTNDDFTGEGFAIVSLQCALIEFFAATVQGKSYRPKRKGGPPLGKHEYDSSRALFVRFLHTEAPFRLVFTPESAEAFYVNVRCGLLHEACTKNGWTIRAHAGCVIDADHKIVYRNNLQKCLERFVTRYGEDLLRRPDRRAAFIRKFDSLFDL